METTIFLAQLWGPVLLAVSAGFFLSPKHYTRIYRDLEKEAFAVLFFGMFAIAGGVAHILFHNAWDTLPQILVSLLGWGVLLKGVICVALPGLADRGGDWALSMKAVPAAGVVMLILGGYLSWIGYAL